MPKVAVYKVYLLHAVDIQLLQGFGRPCLPVTKGWRLQYTLLTCDLSRSRPCLPVTKVTGDLVTVARFALDLVYL